MPDVTITTSGGESFSAYLAVPQKPKGPGVLVIQEIFGVNPYMRNVCDNFAEMGFLALCPDLFWRQQPGVQLSDKSEAEMQKAFQLMQGFDIELGIQDLIASLGHIRKQPGCNGKAAAVGFCLGGRLAYLMAARSDADCAVAYYPVGLETMLEEADNIKKPLMIHLGSQDQYVPKAAQAQIDKFLSRNDCVSKHIYPDMQHAFARPEGRNFNASAARLANARTEDFLFVNLGVDTTGTSMPSMPTIPLMPALPTINIKSPVLSGAEAAKARAALEAKIAARAKAAEKAKIEEEKRKALEAKAAEKAKIEEEKRKVIEAKKAKIEEEKRLEAEMKAAEKAKAEEAKRKEIEKKAAEKAKAEEAKRKDAEKKVAAKAKADEQKRKDAEKKAAAKAALDAKKRKDAEKRKEAEKKAAAKTALDAKKRKEAEKNAAAKAKADEQKRKEAEKKAKAAKVAKKPAPKAKPKPAKAKPAPKAKAKPAKAKPKAKPAPTKPTKKRK